MYNTLCRIRLKALLKRKTLPMPRFSKKTLEKVPKYKNGFLSWTNEWTLQKNKFFLVKTAEQYLSNYYAPKK